MGWWIVAATLLAGVSVDASDWYVVNDTVMGGRSASSVRATDAGVHFSGELSLENNGGFTSTRTEAVDGSWRGREGLRLRVEGDGRTYIATLRLRDRRMRRLYFRQAFETTDGQTTEVTLPFSDFEAFVYGSRVSGVGTADAYLDQVASFGIMLADKQPGTFAIDISEVAPYGEQTSAVRSEAPQRAFSMAIKRGVPLFNAGEAARCADIYETAILDVLVLSEDTLSEDLRTRLGEALRQGRQTAAPDERAWVYRRAMDAVLMAPRSDG